jgi:hypothetical protein
MQRERASGKVETEIEVEVESPELLNELDKIEKRAVKRPRAELQLSKLLLRKVISGGQSGADLAGLMAARKLGLKTRGTAAPNFSTSEGARGSVLKSFGLCAVPSKGSLAEGYCRRSMINVDDSDATVAFRVKPKLWN